MSEREGFKTGIETRSVATGWIATVHNDDGTATDYWAPTEAEARKRAQR